MKQLILLTLVAAVVPTGTAEAMDIADPAQVASLQTVQQNLDAVTDAVMGCMDTGRPHAACLCEHEKLVAQFNDSVATLMSRHQELRQVDLVHFKMPDEAAVSMSLEGLRVQASSTPACP